MKRFVIFSILMLMLPFVHAQQGHMKLLAVSETKDGQVGGIADLFLEIEPGSGRVFLETFPLTRIDTQISTRFAKEIACNFADKDCDDLDFFYTITADSPIIAGPSAGAAIAILTFSLISDVNLDKNTVITGTINSGGLIGPVGGLKAKIEAAEKIGLNKVLIPFGESFVNRDNISIETNETINETFDLEKIREERKIEIIETATLDDALFEFTGKRFRERKSNVTISEYYKDTMKLLAIQLCSRSTRLQKEIPDFFEDNRTDQRRKLALNLSIRGKESFDKNKYYSAASYCFGSNVEFNYLSLLTENLTEDEILEEVEELREEAKDFEKSIDNEKILTITDLESYMVVKERLIEANDFLNLVLETLINKNVSLHNLAYANERINSARSWAKFLENTGKRFDLNSNIIKNACKTKISEVEVRFQYVQLYFPQSLTNSKKELEYAYQDLEEGNYELCLFKASKAKASADTILSVFGVRIENVENIVRQKLDIVETNLVEETEKGIFPVLGYSYFEYANSLKDSDPFSALLYSGYALELSNLDIYFKTAETSPAIRPGKKIDKKLFMVLLFGILIGIITTNIFYLQRNRRRLKQKKPGI